ncbi:exporter of polyketide antibiotics [Paraoerskovia sediminicola]|uniref:Exporter of polyketide antibiotics n=1 Tax=Paraoerskovia sediminicola TaxID=1138587 RepID=A0ABN6XE54_9CELL|nr:ABC transporter permease [Paraoerskovia sediminicola]BDZ43137.1 exporter of polyketide antibiotics [Paraoerskovia sediminicola]
MNRSAAATPTSRGGRRGGFGSVLALQLRTGWVRLLVWIVSLVGVYAATLSAISNLYPDDAALESYGATLDGDPTVAAINGTPYGATDLGGVAANEYAFIAAIAVPLMGLFLVVAQTRAQEESGLLELLRSRSIGARAPWLAAFLVTVVAFLAVGLGIFAAALAGGVDAGAVGLYALSISALGIFFAALATFVGQFVRRGSGVTSVGVGVLGMAFVTRAIGDVNDDGWKWLSPLAWQQETRPFDTDPRWWPLALTLGVAAVLAVAGLVLVARRDLGASLFAARPGPARAGGFARSSFGLALRSHAPSIVAWVLGALLVGVAFGSFGDDVEEMVEANPQLGELLGTGGASDQYTAVVLLLVALMALGVVGQGVGRVRAEESSGRIEPVLARGTSRMPWLGLQGGVVAVGGVLTLVLGGFGLSLSTPSDGGGSAGWDVVLASIDYVPAVLAVAGLGVLVLGLLPRTTWLVWLVVAYIALVGMLGGTLDLPDWAMSLSPLYAIGQVPAESASGWAVVWLSVIAVVLFVGGLVAFRERDVPRT